MTGLSDTDVRLNDTWQLTAATDGDAPLCADLECLFQNIALEAVMQPGDLFYDPDFGWGLYDFLGSENDALPRPEMTQRVRVNLKKREVILPETIAVSVSYEEDLFRLRCSFQFSGESGVRHLDLIIGADDVEVATA